MIYLPKRFDLSHQNELIERLVTSYDFATMISVVDSQPMVSHLPFLYDAKAGDKGTLTAHMARANPHAKVLAGGGEVTVIFQGPHAYITPRWYQPDPEAVPTWNYAVVHMRGLPTIVTDPDEAYAMQKRFVAAYDKWQLDLSPNLRRGLIGGITVFTVEITHIEAKFKMSQNQDDVNVAGVLKGLEQGTPLEQETASWMRKIHDLAD